MAQQRGDNKNPFVFSTGAGAEVCPECGMRKGDCICPPKPVAQGDGVIRLRRETKGRKGAGVTLVEGLPEAELVATASELKKRCGVGGTVKDGVVELQGDVRETAKTLLEKRGRKVKLCGG